MGKLMRISRIQDVDPVRVNKVHAVVKFNNLESFVVREAEAKLRELLGDLQHYVIALHGSSKQGKSNILRSVFGRDFRALHLELGYEPEPESIYKALLSAARASVKRNKAGETKFTWGIDKFFVARNEIKAQETAELVDGDYSDITWVARVLAETSPTRIIVLDNFHHVDAVGQKKLSRDFTVLGGRGFKVVVAGTWKQADYLLSLNTDLHLAYESVSVDPWSAAELEMVVLAGARALGYAMPSDASRTLAHVARGSIAALQSITARFYTGQIKGDSRFDAGTYSQKANLAAQLVAGEACEQMANTLVAVSDWGAVDSCGRHYVSYVVETVLRASPDDVRRGFGVNQLKQKVDELAQAWARQRRRAFSAMPVREFAAKVKAQWMSHQIEHHNTPIIVYDRQLDKVTVDDSMLVFLHNLVASQLRERFVQALADRPMP